MHVCRSIDSLLGCPNPDDPINDEAMALFKQDQAAYREKAKLWTNKYAN